MSPAIALLVFASLLLAAGLGLALYLTYAGLTLVRAYEDGYDHGRDDCAGGSPRVWPPGLNNSTIAWRYIDVEATP